MANINDPRTSRSRLKIKTYGWRNKPSRPEKQIIHIIDPETGAQVELIFSAKGRNVQVYTDMRFVGEFTPERPGR